MKNAALSLHRDFVVGTVDPRLYGSFVEHMGRCVYGGIYEPDHDLADTHGFRTDVLALTRELGVTVVRYPGGNFVSGYRWEDGVGPVDERPTRLDLAWRSVEPNSFGLHEFMTWARLAAVEPMMAVNLGTRGLQEACDLLEYTNHEAGTSLSDLRKTNGSAEPFGVRLWCLGNELDGPWQVGLKSAQEYGVLASQTAKAMRRLQPDLQLVACGSSNERMATFGAWEAEVLTHTYDDVDFISLHAYFEQGTDSPEEFLASSVTMDKFIEGVIASADHVAAKLKRTRKLQLSFDEWNVWNQSRSNAHASRDWAVGPRLIEDEYSGLEGVVVGSLLMSILRHADRVTVACLAQLVNVIGAIRAEPRGEAWRQTIFYPFSLMSQKVRGTVLRCALTSPVYETRRHGDVALVDTLASLEEDGSIVVLAVNRSATDDVVLAVNISGGGFTLAEHIEFGGVAAWSTTNSQEAPMSVTPTTKDLGVTSSESPILVAGTWNVLTFLPRETSHLVR
ncbi:MAG: alpha-L-arabinofuranosidase C-terminal domain-containing protein [Microcella sp.]|uniref:arabinosylfuranosidase ArfA n=1 Tax=Microcella sp. TaxID=1913979 RepID=UPI0033156E8F